MSLAVGDIAVVLVGRAPVHFQLPLIRDVADLALPGGLGDVVDRPAGCSEDRALPVEPGPTNCWSGAFLASSSREAQRGMAMTRATAAAAATAIAQPRVRRGGRGGDSTVSMTGVDMISSRSSCLATESGSPDDGIIGEAGGQVVGHLSSFVTSGGWLLGTCPPSRGS